MKVTKTDTQWREQLSDEQYRVCREKGTERPHTGEYVHFDGAGAYRCICCQQVLFRSATKFDAGCGWPSFWEVADPSAVTFIEDKSMSMARTEVVCSSCDAHLGHVFPDGPEPTGLRYCMNSVALGYTENE